MAAIDPNSVAAAEVAAHFAELLEKVAAGEEITITEQGTPVARLMPIKPVHTPQERRAAIERIKELSKGLSLGGLKIRDMINEGRR